MSKRIFALMLAAVMVLGLTACGGGAEETTKAPAGTKPGAETNATQAAKPDADTDEFGNEIDRSKTELIYCVDGDCGAYDEFTVAATTQSGYVTQGINEALFFSRPDGSYENVLCESYEWENDVTLICHLRDAEFHSGKKMTSEDVVWSYNQLGSINPSSFQYFEGIEAVDEMTVKFTLKEPTVLAINALTYLKVTDSKYFEEVGAEAFGRAPVGTGPFKWADYVSGDHVTLKAFDNYWGTRGTIETLTIRFISEQSQALIELENGNIDVLAGNGQSLKLVEGEDQIAAAFMAPSLNEYLGFNYNSPRVQDVRVRQAINMAIDREQIVVGAYDSIGQASYTCCLPNLLSYLPEAADYYKFDPEGAAALMAEAGFTAQNPLTLKLLTDTSAARSAEAQQIKNFLDACGFNIELQSFDAGTVSSIVSGGSADDYDMILRAIGQGGEAIQAVSALLSLGGTKNGNNPTWINENVPGATEYDELINKVCVSVTSEQEKIENFQALQRCERENALWCYIVARQSIYLYNSKLMGIRAIDDRFMTSTTIGFGDAYFVK